MNNFYLWQANYQHFVEATGDINTVQYLDMYMYLGWEIKLQ